MITPSGYWGPSVKGRREWIRYSKSEIEEREAKARADRKLRREAELERDEQVYGGDRLHGYLVFHEEVWVPHLITSYGAAEDNLPQIYAFYREHWPTVPAMHSGSFYIADVTPEHEKKHEFKAFERHSNVARQLALLASNCKEGVAGCNSHAVSEVTRRLILQFVNRYAPNDSIAYAHAIGLYEKAKKQCTDGIIAKTLTKVGGSGNPQWQRSDKPEPNERFATCPVCGVQSFEPRYERVVMPKRTASAPSTHFCHSCTTRFF